jgi:hypothetical protein
MTLKQYLKSVEACEPAVEWAGNKTIEEVVATCHRGDWLLWLARKCDIGLQPLTLAKGHCASTVWHLIDERTIKAVDVAIAFGEGKATREELDAAAVPAVSANAASASAYAAACAAADAAAHAADGTDAADAADAAADANRMETADICREYIGDLIIEKVNQILTQTP